MYLREAHKIARHGNGILLGNYWASNYVTISGALVASEVCARKYGVRRRARVRSTRGRERLVDCSEARAAVGIEITKTMSGVSIVKLCLGFFFMTRLAAALSMKQAKANTLRELAEELQSRLRNDPFDPPEMTVHEVVEISSTETDAISSAGFTWYRGDPYLQISSRYPTDESCLE